MTLATWLVITHYRPEYLSPVLDHLHGMKTAFPRGWEYEIVVVAHRDDKDGIEVGTAAGAKVVTTSSNTPGGKRNAGLPAVSGALTMTCDDDDFPSRIRPRQAIDAFEKGHGFSGIREYRRLHLPSGMVVRWMGRGSPSVAPVYITMSRNYKTSLLRAVRGWNSQLDMMEETDLHQRLHRRHDNASKVALEKDLGVAQANSTIFLQHDRNIITDRPIVMPGERRPHGPYVIIGEGHWSQVSTFPREVADRLGLGR